MADSVLFQDGELAAHPEPILTQALAIWNEAAKAHNWAVAKVLDTQRKAALRRAVRDYGGIAGFRGALEKIARNDFIMGRIPPKAGFKQFKADLDWFIRPVTVRKVIEDFYEESVPKPSVYEKIRLMTPAAPIPAPFVTTETKEDRLRAMITSYQKYGRYADANRIEEQLAKLEGRPPTLVPAPEVADLGMPPKDATNERPKINEAKTHTDVEWEMVPEGEDFGNE